MGGVHLDRIDAVINNVGDVAREQMSWRDITEESVDHVLAVDIKTLNKKIRDFGLPGQEPGSSGGVPTELHGPISTGPQGNRIYFGYGTNKGGILQIVDRKKLLEGPAEPTPDNLKKSGYLLRCYVTVLKAMEVKARVLDAK